MDFMSVRNLSPIFLENPRENIFLQKKSAREYSVILKIELNYVQVRDDLMNN